MVKKLILVLLIATLIMLGFNYYKQTQQAVECWWGLLYPPLSYIAFEDEESKIANKDYQQLSSLDYIYAKETEEEPIKVKVAIFEWFKNNVLRKEN